MHIAQSLIVKSLVSTFSWFKLFESVIRLSSRMRETTGIAKDIVSLGDVAVKLVEEKAGLDAKKKVLLIVITLNQ